MLPTAQAEGKEREKEMKTGLILEGGAMRGMFSAGVMDVMMENGIRFDGIIGVSAGAAFGVNYKSGQIGRAIRYNAKYCRDKRYCGVGSLLKTGNLFNTEFCYGEVPLKLDVFDFDTYEKNPTAFYVTCTDIESGKPVYHEYTGRNDHGFDWIRASASLPLVSQIVEIDGVKLLDGGIADSIPVAYFESIGYTKNVVILTQPQGYRKEKNRVLPLLRSHFCARYLNESFFLYDRTHKEALFYTGGRTVIRPLEEFQMAPPDETEAKYRLLWKRFYDTIAIRERDNPRCRMTHMPKRYWSTMTEFQGPDFFTPQSSPAGVPAPGAPAGKPVPGIPPAPGRSVPGSSL